MKTLLLIRHAKSSWDSATLNDFDRPLNDRGKKDAPVMAKRLLDKKVQIDLIVSSPAKRARKTAAIFAEEYGIKDKQIIYKEALYAAPAEVFETVIAQLEDQFDHAALFSHNPGLTDFVNTLTTVRVDDLPTCSVFAIKVPVKKWKDFPGADKEFWFFDYPKSGGNRL
ncbi:MAG TPA: histidine phosphatase family protein [Chitinophagaceae bacterium]|nr:histidine phosphatase family protein [Chitinophagaceae bacterium]